MTYWRTILHPDRFRAHRAWVFRGKHGEGRFELEGQTIEEASIYGLHLPYSRCIESTLDRCAITYSDFTGAEIRMSRFERAVLHYDRFDQATIEGCTFQGADLRRCQFWKSIVTNSNLELCHLTQSHFVEAQVASTSMKGSLLEDTTLDRASFTECDFRDVEFPKATAFDTVFIGSDFRQASFSGMRLKNTTFTRCKFGGFLGAPIIEGDVHISDADLSEAADGSGPISASELVEAWRQRSP